ncbi:MAG TPA: hypothetical protein VKA38_02295 [Draconibacterium sp.]|nr:hypothetical protein [Draconibacterium sp.]
MNLKIVSIILISFSGLAVITVIILGDKLKKGFEKRKYYKNTFWNQLFNLSGWGFGVILIYILSTIGNSYTTIKSISNSEKKAYEDSLSAAKIIQELNAKRITDSIKIAKLERLTIDNGLKSDSIKLAVVDNAVKELEEQRKAVDRERENIFLHFKNEVKNNLKKIELQLQDTTLDGFKNTSEYFISTRLSNTYIKKYQTVTNNNTIVEYLMELDEYIEKVNYYAESASNKRMPLKAKSTTINMMKGYVSDSRSYLLNIYSRVYYLDSYKEYENADFSKEPKLFTKNELNLIFLIRDIVTGQATKISSKKK